MNRQAMPPEPAERPTVVSIRIGNFMREYKLFQTNASQRLDYGYVLTLVDADDTRYILIPLDRAAYQIGRYGSDLAWAIPSDVFDVDTITERLFKAITDTFTQPGAE